MEEAAHGNDVQALSIDGAGYNGPVLRELEDSEGLKVATYVPVPAEPASGLFTPKDFVEDVESGKVTCPAGETSTSRGRDNGKQTTKHRFACRITRRSIGGHARRPIPPKVRRSAASIGR
jgi:hypothetical protein